MLQEIFCKALTCFILIFCSSREPAQKSMKKKKNKRISFDISRFLILYHLINVLIKIY